MMKEWHLNRASDESLEFGDQTTQKLRIRYTLSNGIPESMYFIRKQARCRKYFDQCPSRRGPVCGRGEKEVGSRTTSRPIQSYIVDREHGPGLGMIEEAQQNRCESID